MVLALGSLTSSKGDSTEDLQYYRLAKQYLQLDCFGSGRLETVQALVLMGGQYLHFRNQPNMASAILGACYRIACGIGLNRKESEDYHGRISLQEEVKQRNWWTLYVLDMWGSMTLGRPSATPGISIDTPNNVLDEQRGETSLTEPMIHAHLIHNINLCRIINRIQNRLIVNPILGYDEMQHLDKMLVSWFHRIPLLLYSHESSAPGLHDARLVLEWRYQNTRSFLHRPSLLDTVIKRAPLASLSTIDQIIVSKCRDIAADSIFSIQAEWRPTKICCWNAVWFLCQACLVPLMALIVESPDHCKYQSWCNQVQLGISVCEKMTQLSSIGPKAKAFLERLFVAVTNASSENSQYPVSTNSYPRTDKMMGLLEHNWDYFGENDTFAPFDYSGLSYLDDRLLPQYLQPFT